uniref:Dynein light chain Tctex-type 4 n=1 Tax=Sphenodon punctatus TaxID=8508 RepID=A0A8D0G8D3_SPHPU
SRTLANPQGSPSAEVPPKPLLQLRSIEEGKPPMPASRRSSLMSILNVPFSSRRSSVAAAGRRLSVGPWMHCGRVSFSGLPLFEPIQEMRCENSYKTQPDPGCRFDACRTQRVLEVTLASYLGNAKYSPASSGQLVQSLSELVRSKAKELAPPRYKLVCNVFLGQQDRQSLYVASRAVWDADSDSFASATFANSSLFVVATVHGVYFE